MDFTFHKLTHIFSLFLLLCSLVMVIGLPIIQYFEPLPTASTIGNLPGSFQMIFEIFVVLFSLLFVFGLFMIIPMVWYFLVNHLRLREMMHQVNLHFGKIDRLILWGVIAAVGGLAISFGIDMILIQLGFDLTNASNIPALEQLFSLPTLLILVTVQPIAEEFFFRGFLFDKIKGFAGGTIAVIATGVMFGIAHLSYGMIYTAFMATLLGIWFGVIVLKTKNLTITIIGHILLNVTGIALYLFGKSLGI